jgi:hypothetical protein
MQTRENRSKLVINYFKLIIFLLFPFCGLSQQGKENNENIDSLINFHFKELASAVKAKPKDTIYYGHSGSIMFIEEQSGIYSKADGTAVGKLYFTKSDFIKWRKWYLSRYSIPKG